MSMAASGQSTVPCLTDIVDGQIYLGNVAAAKDTVLLKELGITNVLSVCGEYRSTGPNFHLISVEDSEYEDILIHLSDACDFIQKAVDRGEKILVHCVYGVSRSATVVTAYLMKTRGIDPQTALRYIKDRRPQIQPNYGFIKQLEAFEKCNYTSKTSHPAYRRWKRLNVQDVTNYLNRLDDVATIIPERLLLASELPEEGQQALSLLGVLGVTHIITISPTSTSVPSDDLKGRHHIEVPEGHPEAIMDLLPKAVSFIQQAGDQAGCVLLYSENEPRACIAACAYLVATGKVEDSEGSRKKVQAALPLSSPSEAWIRRLRILDDPTYLQSLKDAVAEGSRAASHSIPTEMCFPPPPIAKLDSTSLSRSGNEFKTPGQPFNMDDLSGALSNIHELVKPRPETRMPWSRTTAASLASES
ncbi:protein-tyrosine phosphatase-like protein [Coprinopsis sp. MPI-PUGE-AT-0042]|nr:protein-tyrosine phosphatase-like protein [Coprinopsis sp. MPI-PUGE-AT-0042]